MVRLDPMHEAKKAVTYVSKFLLWPYRWENYPNPIPLEWKCEKFERKNSVNIPEGKGVYAFFVKPKTADFPSHSYLMYIGQSGHESKRHLRKRFGDYFSERKGVNRVLIKHMLIQWEGYLYFYYAEVDPDQYDLKELEQILLDTFAPPFSERGFSARVRDVVKLVRKIS